MEISSEDLLKMLATFLSGGGLGCLAVRGFVRTEARKEIAPDLKGLHERINHVENDYVSCKYCDAQKDNFKDLFDSIDHKLDILLGKK